MPKGCLWVVAALGALFIWFVISSKISEEKKAEQYKGPWTSLSYEQKDAWIKDYLKQPDDQGYALISEMRNDIVSKFDYPEEVEFTYGQTPTFVNADVVDADRGVTFVRGTGTAKNSFGVKQGFIYSVRLVVTKDSFYLDDVSVNLKR